MAKHVYVFTNRIIELWDEGMQRWNEILLKFRQFMAQTQTKIKHKSQNKECRLTKKYHINNSFFTHMILL